VTALLFLLLCSIWGTTWSVIQIGLRGIPPFTGVSLRFAIAGLLLLALALARGVKLGRSRHEVGLWALNGLLSFTICYGVVYWAEQWVPSGLAAVLFATYPLFVAILAYFILPAEPLQRAEIIGILVGFVGVVTIFSADFDTLGGAEVVRGSLVMLLSPLAAAGASVSIKRWGGGIHPLSHASVPMIGAAAVLGVVAVATERGQTVSWTPASVSALLYLAIAGSAVTFSLYFWLLSHLPAKRLALIAYVVPVVAMGIGFLRGEPITLTTLVGSVCVIVGVAVAVQS
jgi:drug/metabolite transporter (DMT)-like permease